MASIFNKIGNFLKKDEVRAGLSLGGAVAGFGGFEGMKYGDALTKGFGGLNVASGLSAGGLSGGLQAGLGGYGLAQGFGKVGTFNDSYNSIFGKGPAQAQQPIMSSPTSRPTYEDRVRNYYMGNKSRTGNYAFDSSRDMNVAQDLDAMVAAGFTQEDLEDYYNETPRKFAQFQPGFKAPVTSVNTATQMAGLQPGQAGSLVGGANTAAAGVGPTKFSNVSNAVTSTSQVPVSTNSTNSTNSFRIGTETVDQVRPVQQVASPASAASTVVNNAAANTVVNNAAASTTTDATGQMMVTASGKSVPSIMMGNQQMVVGENGLLIPASKWVEDNTEGSGFSFEAVYDNIAEKAMDDPLQAVSVGAALVTAFAESPQEKAAKEYAEQVARVRAQTDPSSDYGQTFMAEYTTQRETELKNQYAQAKSDWVNTMAKRGLSDSTIASEGIASLDAKFADLQSKLPMDAMTALQQYQNNQFQNMNAGLAPATNQARLMAGQVSPFSNASTGAIASVGS
jgi:hypothetical protein